jgi:hypothetical protein
MNFRDRTGVQELSRERQIRGLGVVSWPTFRWGHSSLASTISSTPRASRGLSDFDRRQRFVASAVYDLPTLAGSSKLVRSLQGG